MNLSLQRIIKSVSGLIATSVVALLAAANAHADNPAETLRNGMRLIINERHRFPMVTIDLWVRAGSADEGPGQDGCAHFLEHTLFKGTTLHGPGYSDFTIESAGGSLDAETGADFAHYYTEIPSDKLNTGLKEISDIIRHAVFPDTEVERERAVILDELARHDERPAARIQDRLYNLAFGNQPYAKSPGGEPTAIKFRARDSLVAFYSRNYVPQRCALILAGDVDSAAATRAVDRYFGDWTSPEDQTPQPIPAPAQTVSRARMSARRGERPVIGIAYAAPSAVSRSDSAVAEVVAEILSSQFGRGTTSIAAWSGTAVTVNYAARHGTSLLSVIATLQGPPISRPFEQSLSPAISDIPMLEAALRKAIDSLATQPPSASTVSAAVRTLQGQIAYDIETNTGLAREMGLAATIGGSDPAELSPLLSQIKPEHVQNFAMRWLTGKQSYTVILDAEQAE